MARTRRWQEERISAGFWSVKCSRWQSFYEFVDQRMLDYNQYIWRGQSNSKWKLIPAIYRNLVGSGQYLDEDDRTEALELHLKNFKLAARGCGVNLNDDAPDSEWWSFGQHYGLATPLLDWTRSPFVATYFAAREAADSEEFAVWAIQPFATGIDQYLSVLEPMSGNNQRLVVQGGLFTMSNVDKYDVRVLLGNWIKTQMDMSDNFVIIKFLIPSSERLKILRILNRMNINHRSLFPEMYGAAKFANMKLEIKNY